MGALLVATLLAALLIACQEPTRADPAASTLPLRPLVPDDARIVRDRAHALSVALPPGWTRGRESLLPGLALPESSILTIATFPARADPRRACGDWPDMPQVAVGPRDALLHVEEELDAQPGSRPRRERGYWAFVHGPLRSACVIENEAWFSDGPPGARVRAVLDPSRTKGLRWCRGRFRGVVRYRDAICRRRGPCDRVYRRPAGHLSFTVR